MVRKFLQIPSLPLTMRLSLVFDKRKIFTFFFAKQRTFVSNNNVLQSELTCMTDEHSLNNLQ